MSLPICTYCKKSFVKLNICMLNISTGELENRHITEHVICRVFRKRMEKLDEQINELQDKKINLEWQYYKNSRD